MVSLDIKVKEGAALEALMAGVNQAQFAKTHALPGGASMLSQHISGHRPISLKAARIYAAGLNVPVEAFSARLAAEIDALQKVSAAASEENDAEKAPPPPYLPGFESLSIPVLANAGSMGPGNDQLHDDVVIGRLTVSPEWALKTLKPTSLQNLRFIHGYGDSMRGTYDDGDILLVDVGVQDPKIDGVYVLEANQRLYIKRVRQRIDGSYEISSDNPNIKTVDVLNGDQQVSVHGRVVWAWNGKKL